MRVLLAVGLGVLYVGLMRNLAIMITDDCRRKRESRRNANVLIDAYEKQHGVGSSPFERFKKGA